MKTWLTIKSRKIVSTPWLTIKEDKVKTHLGEEITYTYMDHPGCVIIVALTEARELILLNHYRYPLNKWCWELPAGRIEGGCTLLGNAKRELYQEAGAVARDWKRISSFYNSTGTSTEKTEVFLAGNVIFEKSRLERTELIKAELVLWEQAVKMAKIGVIKDGASSLAILLSEYYFEMNNTES